MLTELQKHLALYNNNEELHFEEEAHVYTKGAKNYISATTLIGTFEPEFDKEFWAMYTALKNHNLKVKPEPAKRAIIVNGKLCELKSLLKDNIYKCWYEEVVAKWKGINAEACHRGNVTHNFLEDSINKSKGYSDGSDNHKIHSGGVKAKNIETVHDLDSTAIEDAFPTVYKRLKGYIERDCIIYAEKRLHLDLAQIAGTIDVPIIKRGTNKFAILDWKTNKDEFKPTSGYYKKEFIGGTWVKTDKFVETDDTFNYPLNHLALCKLNIYTLQLSLYAYMLEVWGYELVPNGLEIMHIRPGREEKLIRLPYLKHEIELIIKHRLKEIGLPFFDSKAIEDSVIINNGLPLKESMKTKFFIGKTLQNG